MKIGITGCRGKMGCELLKRLINENDVIIAAGLEKQGSESIGSDILEGISTKALGVKITDNPLELFDKSDVVIDFSNVKLSVELAKIASQKNKSLVIGTTGFNDEENELIKQAALTAPILKAANMSLGVNLLLSLVEKASKVLYNDFDIEILEMHHKHKIDAPSGTALALGEAAAKGANKSLKNVITPVSREGLREQGKIGFAVLRGGSVVGEHSVIFAGLNERIELSHKSESRIIFVNGAIKAAKWLYQKPAGLYNMQDVLEI